MRHGRAWSLSRQLHGGSIDVEVLRGCRELSQARRAHARIGRQEEPQMGTILVQMYGRCGSVADAVAAFEAIKNKDVFSWSVLIAAYAQNGHYAEALGLLWSMANEGIKSNHVTLLPLLKACPSLDQARQIHARAMALEESGRGAVVLGTAIITMYGKCGSPDHAQRVFDEMLCLQHDAVAWNALMVAYTQNGHGPEALELYHRMVSTDNGGSLLVPNRCTYLTGLVACSLCGPRALVDGRRMHQELGRCEVNMDVAIGNTLMSMYAKCGSLEEAEVVFQGLETRNEASWSAVIGAYAQYERFGEAVKLYYLMNQDGGRPNRVTFLSVLAACSTRRYLAEGRQVHSRLAALGLQADQKIGNALISMYSRCGSVEEARMVFEDMPQRNVISWTSLIAAHAELGDPQKAVGLFKRMEEETGMEPDEVAYMGVLDAISIMGDVQAGKAVHDRVRSTSSHLVSTALIKMYGKCGYLDEARLVFEGTFFKDVVAYTSMITAYAQNGQGKKALLVLREMDLEGVHPNRVTFVSALDACSDKEDLPQGSQVHSRLSEFPGVENDVIVGTALVNLYHKCGGLDAARRAFEGIVSKNVVAWNAIIEAYSHRGHIQESSWLLQEMTQAGLDPSVVTFTCLLFGCNHAGLVEDAVDHFVTMVADYGVDPVIDNYACIVDLLGRAGHLEQVEELLHKLPLPPSSVLWMSFLGACKIHSDPERGRRAMDKLAQLEPTNAGSYIVLSNLYACS